MRKNLDEYVHILFAYYLSQAAEGILLTEKTMHLSDIGESDEEISMHRLWLDL